MELEYGVHNYGNDIRKLQNDVKALSSENKKLKKNIEKGAGVLELQNELLYLIMDKDRAYYTILLLAITIFTTDISELKFICLACQIAMAAILFFYQYPRIDKCEKKIKELKNELRR